jgi:DNA-binding GntR family transcriptional regulator
LTEVHAFSSQPLVSATLAQQIADRIVDAIARGDIKGGRRMVEAELAALLGVSRLPVREALRSLVDQGLLVPSQKRGLQVIAFDGEWARELSGIRIALELACVRLVVKRLKKTPAIGKSLLDPLSTMQACAARLDRDGVNRADIAMHSTLYAIADSPLLSAIWSGISRHVLILFSIESIDFGNFDQVVEEHQRYATVVLSCDLKKIEREIHRHFTEFRLIAESVGNDRKE